MLQPSLRVHTNRHCLGHRLLAWVEPRFKEKKLKAWVLLSGFRRTKKNEPCFFGQAFETSFPSLNFYVKSSPVRALLKTVRFSLIARGIIPDSLWWINIKRNVWRLAKSQNLTSFLPLSLFTFCFCFSVNIGSMSKQSGNTLDTRCFFHSRQPSHVLSGALGQGDI